VADPHDRRRRNPVAQVHGVGRERRRRPDDRRAGIGTPEIEVLADHDLFRIRPGLDDDRVALGGRVDRRLDRRKVSRHDQTRLRPSRSTGRQQAARRQPEHDNGEPSKTDARAQWQPHGRTSLTPTVAATAAAMGRTSPWRVREWNTVAPSRLFCGCAVSFALDAQGNPRVWRIRRSLLPPGRVRCASGGGASGRRSSASTPPFSAEAAAGRRPLRSSTRGRRARRRATRPGSGRRV
jgi:hypothetical protein